MLFKAFHGWGSVAACSLVCAASAPPGWAQPVTPAIESLTPDQAEQARLRALVDTAPKAYEDQFMSADEITALRAGEPSEADLLNQPDGLRSWSVESRLGMGQSSGSSAGQRRATEFGQRIEYRQQSLNYGEWTLQADARSIHGSQDAWNGVGGLGYARESSSQRITLRNLAAPITPSLFADTSLGDTYSELTTGLSRNYRLSLGSSNVRGLATRIYSSDFDLRAGIGERGDLQGGPYPGFEKSQGSVAWLGATQGLGGAWYGAAQLSQASDIPSFYYNPFSSEGSGSKTVSSWAAALGYGSDLRYDGDIRARLTALGSRTSASTLSASNAQGWYLETGARWGRFRHEFGLYRTQPDLYFGDFLLNSGSQGSYWRMDHSANRWSWGAGFDYEQQRPNSTGQQGSKRLGLNANVQWLMDRHSSVGGSVNVTETRYDSTTGSQSPGGQMRSQYVYGYYQTRFFDAPRSRLSLTLRRNQQIVLGDSNATGSELQWEQDWIRSQRETMRTEITTTLGWTNDRSGGDKRQYPTAGVQLRYWPSNTLSVSGNLRYTSQSGSLYTSRGLSGSLTAEKNLGHGWRMGLSALLNQARTVSSPVLNWTGPQIYRSNDKTAYVYLRWEGSTGRPFAIAGGAPGSGAGNVTGRVFYDNNRDGLPQIGEDGVRGVEVVLDGRYRTSTDSDGRFSFPMEGVGRHQLSLTLDSVPLPWGAAGTSGVSVDVPLRGEANAEIPVVKVGE